MRLRRLFVGSVCAIGIAAGAACGPAVDLTTGLRLESLTTGWTDTGDGRTNRLVPAVSFRLKNASDQTLAPLQVNAIFRRAGEEHEWSNAMVTAAGSQGLPPTASTDQ